MWPANHPNYRPGGPAIEQDTYKVSYDLKTTNIVGLSTLAPDTGSQYTLGSNCKGQDLSLRIGVHIPADDDQGLEGTDEYAIAFPWIGKTLACPNNGVIPKLGRALAANEIEVKREVEFKA